MVNVEDALNLVKKYLPQWGGDAEITSCDLVADRDYPPFHRVMMDGVALSFQAYQAGQRQFRVAGICPAGRPEVSLKSSEECYEVMTGAALPSGADMVIPYEHLKIVDGVAEVVVSLERQPYDHIHFQGSDSRQGQSLLRAGQVLNGPHWGIATSLGYTSPPMVSLPRVMIISTGDELVDAAAVPKSYQIRRSNPYALRASLQLYGYSKVELFHLPDDPTSIQDHFQKAAPQFDIMFYSGGVSMGKFDFLPGLWRELGVTEHFHGVAQRPGKPLWFGVDERRKTTVFGLPGNPVSSLVCLHRYFLSRKDIHVQLGDSVSLKGHLTHFVPAKLEFNKNATLVGYPLKIKNSGEFAALAESDGFVELPGGVSNFKEGDRVLFHPWRPL